MQGRNYKWFYLHLLEDIKTMKNHEKIEVFNKSVSGFYAWMLGS